MSIVFRAIGNRHRVLQYGLQTALVTTAICAFWLGDFVAEGFFSGIEVALLSAVFTALTLLLVMLPLKYVSPLVVAPLACTSLSLLRAVVATGLFYDGPLYRFDIDDASYAGFQVGLICGVLIWLSERVAKSRVARSRKLRRSWRRTFTCCLLLVSCYLAALGLGELLERRKWTRPGANLITHLPAPYGHRIVEFRGYGVTDESLPGRLAREVPKDQEVWMSFFYTQVSDEGLKELEAYTGLREVDLRGTKVSAAGVRRLKKVLPNCRIRW